MTLKHSHSKFTYIQLLLYKTSIYLSVPHGLFHSCLTSGLQCLLRVFLSMVNPLSQLHLQPLSLLGLWVLPLYAYQGFGGGIWG